VLFSLSYQAIRVNKKYLLDQERKTKGELLSLSPLAPFQRLFRADFVPAKQLTRMVI
jgi:hypothetical protein